MQIKDVIKTKRRECGYTQEQVAASLGVSTPAVNKWESGASFPDIALLAPLARLLKTDVNTLLCFKENLTKEDVVRYVVEVSGRGQKEGMEKAIERIRELVKEYPSCAELLQQMAMTLTGLQMAIPSSEEQREEIQALSRELFERVAESDEPEYANRARYMLASRLIQEENYDRAMQMIEKVPVYDGLDKCQLEILLYMKKKDAEQAGKLLERKIYQLIQETFLMLNHLATVAVWEKDNDRAEALAEYGKQLMGIYDWDYSKYTIAFSVAIEQKDADRCMELLKIMLACLKKPMNQTNSVLYTHLRKEGERSRTDEKAALDNQMQTSRQLREALLAVVEKDEQFAFLREKYGDVVELLKNL